MTGLLARALFAGGGLGLLDGLLGLSAVGYGGKHLAGLLVVVAFHQALAVIVALAIKLLLPDLGQGMQQLVADWLQARRGAAGELGRALAYVSSAVIAVLAWGLASGLLLRLEGAVATKRYEHLMQVVGVGAVIVLALLVAWRVAQLLCLLPFRGPLTRLRLVSMTMGLGCTGYALLWVWRDLFFKEIPPVLGLLLIGHGLAVLWAQMPRPAVTKVPLGMALLCNLLLLVGLGGSSSIAPMMRSGAPASGILVQGFDRFSDWDGDGVASHFGARDCAPFDAAVFPGAVDLPDDGIDQDCYHGDLVRADGGKGQKTELPKVGHLRRPKNIVLISVDALRPDRLGFYGYKRHPTSPGMDAWAKDAVVFENAHTSGPYTIAALPGLLSAHGTSQIPNYSPDKGSYMLASELDTLPELMRKLGYRTAAVTSGINPKRNGFTQGIDQLFVVTQSKDDTADRVADQGKKWLDRMGDRRAFLWMHFFDPHDPYKVMKGFDFGGSASDRYDASIAFMDKHLAPLLRRLAEDPDNVVVLVADHGEAFGEHGATHHGNNVYSENTRIPFVVRWGGAKAQHHRGAASILDVLPTLVQLAGGKTAPGYGRSLVPQLLGEPSDLKRGVLTESYRKGQLYALSTADHRLIYVQNEGRYERYDTVKDPGELNDLFGQDTLLDKALEDQLYAHLAQGVLLRRGLTVQRMMAPVLPPGAALQEPQRFGEELELVGFRWFVGGRSKEKPEYILSLYWRALKSLKRSWRIAVGASSGRHSINRDHKPGYGYVPGRRNYPTYEWPVGVIIEDQVVMGRMERYGIRDYSLSLGVYQGKDKLLPQPGLLKHTPKGTRVILSQLKRVKPLIWGRFSSGAAKK